MHKFCWGSLSKTKTCKERVPKLPIGILRLSFSHTAGLIQPQAELTTPLTGLDSFLASSFIGFQNGKFN
jgi:hypothetical protein